MSRKQPPQADAAPEPDDGTTPLPPPDPIMTPERFRAGLERLGLTQRQAAERLGVKHKARVSEWATGKRTIPLYIGRLMDALVELADCR